MGKAWYENLEPGAGIRSLLAGLGKLLIKPPVVAYLALALTLEFWLPYALYYILRTWLFGLGATFMWMLAVAAAFAFLGGAAYLICWSFKNQGFGNAYMAAKRSGDAAATAQKLLEFRASRKTPRWQPIWLSLLSVFVLVPSTAALVVVSSPAAGIKKDHGRLRYLTHDEEVRGMIHLMERRGPGYVFGRKPS